MPAEIRVYLNDRGLTLPPGASVRDAIRLGAPDLLPDCEAGQAGITDARMLPVGLDDGLVAGAILRVTRSSRRTGG
ncbi:MAG TPA: hypothetical protein VG692_06590 [Gemmatimonadales bacterium]|nr:hypothetical protein [Gemmatimonadales bacterium]